MRELLATIRKNGGRSRLIALVVILFTVAVCGLFSIRRLSGDLEAAAGIFLIALLGFSIVAWLTFDSVKVWRAVDYPWVCTSFVAIAFALSISADTDKKRELQIAKNDYLFSMKVYADHLREMADRCQSISVLTQIEMEACKLVPNILKMAQDELKKTETRDVTGGSYHYLPPSYPGFPWTENQPEVYPSNDIEWRNLRWRADSARRGVATYGTKRDEYKEWERSWKARFARTGGHIWYILLAFFVGLRLSRTTAELLQAREAERARRATEEARLAATSYIV